MELKIFRDTMPQASTVCTVKAELPLETEILVSDYLPPVFKLVKCFAKPVILQKQLQPGRLTLEGYLRCTVYYQARRVQVSARPNRNCPLQSSWNCRNLTLRPGRRWWRVRPNTSTAGWSIRAAWRCGVPWGWWRPCAPRTKRR